jgi:hypothetical protein
VPSLSVNEPVCLLSETFAHDPGSPVKLGRLLGFSPGEVVSGAPSQPLSFLSGRRERHQSGIPLHGAPDAEATNENGSSDGVLRPDSIIGRPERLPVE